MAIEWLHDFEGLPIRLTDERRDHILEHSEMAELAHEIEPVLVHPEQVVQSSSDASVRLYYRLYRGTPVGDKLLCVVVKVLEGDAFIITAYLTDTLKRGAILWPLNQ